MNYFELLNLEKIYKIDFNLLNQRYLEMQMKYHPDKAENNQQKEQCLSISMNLNKAYSTLKDDLARAEYLLSLEAIDCSNFNSTKHVTNYTLEKIWHDLEKLEQLQEVKEIENFYSQKVEQQKTIINNIQESFAQRQLTAMQNNIIELRYLNNLINNIKVKVENANTRN